MRSAGRPTPMRGRSQPSRDEVLCLPQLHRLHHPIAESLMTMLRDVRTPYRDFAFGIQALTHFLLWQALTEAGMVVVEVPGYSGPVAGRQLAGNVAGVAVLRAGLGMIGPVRQLIPPAPIYQIGIRRDEATLQPSVYSSNLPPSLDEVQHLLILDPMLATGGSAITALEIVRDIYPGKVSCLAILSAPVGVQRLVDADPSVRIYLVALDDSLDDHGFIVHGLGDAGDRLFGTS